MGNAVPCCFRGLVVKVMLPDATIKKYDHAVQVAELTSAYPSYAVVHCSSAKPGRGQPRSVIILRMDDILVPGQAYILHPIPKSINDSIHISASTNGTFQPQPVFSAGPTDGGEVWTTFGSGRRMGSGREEGLITHEALENNLSQCLMGPAIRRTVPSEGICLLDMEKEEKSAKESKNELNTEKKAGADVALEPPTWTPELYQISED